MPKNNSNVALPARMDLAENAFTNLTIAVLMLPFAREVKNFCNDMQQVLHSKKKIYPPYRQLNNGLLACTSTLTHGFEWLETIDYIPQHRALAVGRSENISDNIPTTEQIHDLIFAWATTWTKQYTKKKKGNKDEIESVCDRFLDAIENIPDDWQWEYIEPATLIKDINSNKGLSYQAIPSLLATLLHKQTITIQLKDREQKITWRKVQGDGSSKTLVKLTIKNNDNKLWQEQLPDLLAAFKARSLTEPQEILNNPVEHGNLENQTWNKDEYYLIHTEGYKYKEQRQKGRGHGHHIDTGFSLQERANITSKVLQLLNGVLIPDKPMECDLKAPSGKKSPLAMQNYDFISKDLYLPPAKREKLGLEEVNRQKQEDLQNRKNIINDSFIHSLDNKPIYLFMIYREEHTKKLVYKQLRESLLLKEGDRFPDYLVVQDILIDDSYLFDRISVSGLPSVNDDFNEEIRKGHNRKRKAWQKFLKNNVLSLVENKNQANIFAIIEIKQTQEKGIHPQQNLRGVIREACVLENINSQMLQTVKPTEKDETVYSAKTRGRTLNAVLDITLRQTGILYGLPSEVYQVAKISEDMSQKLDVIAFCRIKKNNSIGKSPFQYAIAVRLRATGIVDVLLPNHKKWIPYTKAGIAIGKLFHEVRKARNTQGSNRKILDQVQMKGGDLVKFVSDTLVNRLENSTITLIEADVWRNETSKLGSNNKAWFQLKNEYLLEQRNILNFTHVLGHNCQYGRDDQKIANLLGVIRLRYGQETPQYVTSRNNWDDNTKTEDFTQLSGFIDKTVPELLYYFSIGRIPETQKKKQNTPKARNLSKIEHEGDIYAANIAYKHQQMIEMLPFFVRRDFQIEENLKVICRIPHYLRTSPAHTKGNIKRPYPMHLGINLIKDFLCILDLDT